MMVKAQSHSRVATININEPSTDLINDAASIVIGAGLVVAPTETRYGLITRADSKEALQTLYKAKNRPASMPSAIFVTGIDEIKKIAELSDGGERLAQKFLPGPLTLVLKATSEWPEQLLADGKIGIRWSLSKVITQLLEKAACPLTATSANRSGDIDPTTMVEIARVFGMHVTLYLDGGPLEGPTSTVVDCSSDRPVILRQGVISEKEIMAEWDRE